MEIKQHSQATTIEILRLETGWKFNALLIKDNECIHLKIISSKKSAKGYHCFEYIEFTWENVGSFDAEWKFQQDRFFLLRNLLTTNGTKKCIDSPEDTIDESYDISDKKCKLTKQQIFSLLSLKIF